MVVFKNPDGQRQYNIVLSDKSELKNFPRTSFERLHVPGKNSSSNATILQKEKEPQIDLNGMVNNDDDECEVEEEAEEAEEPETEPSQISWKSVPEIIENLEDYPLPSHTPTFKVTHGASPMDYLRMFFPFESIDRWVILTIIKARKIPREREISKEELLKYLGLRLKMIFLPFSQVHDYWASESPDGLSPPTKFGQTRGMSRHRFEIIEQNLQFNTEDEYPVTLL